MQRADLPPPGTPAVLAPPAPNVRRLAALGAEGREALWWEQAEEGAPVACEVCGAEDLDRWDTGQTWGETLCDACDAVRMQAGTARPPEDTHEAAVEASALTRRAGTAFPRSCRSRHSSPGRGRVRRRDHAYDAQRDDDHMPLGVAGASAGTYGVNAL